MAFTKNDYWEMEQETRRLLADGYVRGDKGLIDECEMAIIHFQQLQRDAPYYVTPPPPERE